MPPRTNRFQEIVGFFTRIKFPGGEIESSKMAVSECGEIANYKREIDFVVSTQMGESSIRIAVEANGEGTPLDTPDFESFLARYWGPCRLEGIDHLILVTRKGYAQQVYDKVAATNQRGLTSISLLTLDEALDTDWERVSKGVSFKQGPVRIVHIGINSPSQVDGSNAGSLEVVHSDTLQPFGSLSRYVAFHVSRLLPANPEILRRLHASAQRSPAGDGFFLLSATLNSVSAITPEGPRPLPHAYVTLHTHIEFGTAQVRSCVLYDRDGGKDELTYLEIDVAGDKVQMAFPKSDIVPRSIHIKLPKSLGKLLEEHQSAIEKRKRDDSGTLPQAPTLIASWSAEMEPSKNNPFGWFKPWANRPGPRARSTEPPIEPEASNDGD